MKPILFNTEMVRAILEGRKTVTRRVVKFPKGQNPAWSGYIPDGGVLYGSNNIPAAKASYQAGDILWIRETWNCLPIPEPLRGTSKTYWYKADGAELRDKWRPSIHMPREAARIFLRVTGVRVERLQSLNTSDLIAEGITPRHSPGRCRCAWAVDGCMDAPCPNRDGYEFFAHLEPFAELWDRTMRPADRPCYGWEANPWVWVITFERISKEEAGSNGETEY